MLFLLVVCGAGGVAAAVGLTSATQPAHAAALVSNNPTNCATVTEIVGTAVPGPTTTTTVTTTTTATVTTTTTTTATVTTTTTTTVPGPTTTTTVPGPTTTTTVPGPTTTVTVPSTTAGVLRVRPAVGLADCGTATVTVVKTVTVTVPAPAPQSAPSANNTPSGPVFRVSVRGTVSCTSHPVEGVLVESSGGGSGRAAFKREKKHARIATYAKQVHSHLPTEIRLHVGCGGTVKKWWSDNRTRPKTINAVSVLNAHCREGVKKPAAGDNNRCTWGLKPKKRR